MLKIRRLRPREHVIPICLLFFTALFFSFATYFFYYSNGSYGHDAGIFAYVGMAMKEGRTLYTEVWENKGPLLYFINMLGCSLSHEHGIYWLELIALFITALFAYKTSLMLTNRWIATIAAIFSMLPLSASLEGGNLCEEYALPFMCVGLYFAVKFYAQDCLLKRYEMVIFGACIGAVLLLRANILMLFAAVVIVTIVVLIKNRAFKILAQLFLFSFIGCVAFILPFAIYLAINGAFWACLDIAYLGVLGSFIDLPKIERLRNVRDMLERFSPSGAYYLSIVFVVVVAALFITKRLKDKNTKYVLSFVALGMVLNLWANSLSGVMHMHYFMTFIPILVIPAAWLFHIVYKWLSKVSVQSFGAVLGTFALVLLLSFDAMHSLSSMVIDNIRTPDTPNTIYNQMANYVEQNTEPDELVQFFGGAESVTSNYRTQRLAGSKYSYFANGSFTPEAKEKFATEIALDLVNSKPRLILFNNEQKYQDFVNFIKDRTTWDRFLEERYTQESVDFGFLVYRRQD